MCVNSRDTDCNYGTVDVFDSEISSPTACILSLDLIANTLWLHSSARTGDHTPVAAAGPGVRVGPLPSEEVVGPEVFGCVATVVALGGRQGRVQCIVCVSAKSER